MCSLSLLPFPVNGYAQDKSSCLHPMQHISTCPKNTPSCSPYCGKPSATLSLQQSRCKIYDGTRQTEYQIHVRDGMVDKSLHQNYRKQSHMCASISCTGGLFRVRKFPSGCWPCMYGYTHYSVATQHADYNDYLIFKLLPIIKYFPPDGPIVIK